MTTPTIPKEPRITSADVLVQQLFAVIYTITGAAATIEKLSTCLDQTDIGRSILCPEIAIGAVSKRVYDLGDEAFELLTKIEEQLNGGVK